MPFLDTQNYPPESVSPLKLDVQLFRGSLPSVGLCAPLPSIIRRNSVAMKLLSIRMTALNKDVVTTLIAQHGTIRQCTVCCKHALICCGMSRMHDMMIYNIILNSSRGFLLISYLWAVKNAQEKKLDVAEMMMLRWMSGVTSWTEY